MGETIDLEPATLKKQGLKMPLLTRAWLSCPFRLDEHSQELESVEVPQRAADVARQLIIAHAGRSAPQRDAKLVHEIDVAELGDVLGLLVHARKIRPLAAARLFRAKRYRAGERLNSRVGAGRQWRPGLRFRWDWPVGGSIAGRRSRLLHAADASRPRTR